jgi:hypothetical protein
LNGPDAELSFSSDEGKSWQEKGNLGGWNDFLFTQDGGFRVVYADLGEQKIPQKLFYYFSEHPQAKQIYQAGFSENGVLGEQIRNIQLRQDEDLGLWAFFLEGISGIYEYRLLYSANGEHWVRKDSILAQNPNSLPPAGFVIAPDDTQYAATSDGRDDKLSIFRSSDNQWTKIMEGIGENGPGRGFTRTRAGAQSDINMFAGIQGNVYIFWKQNFSKEKISSVLFPIELIRYIPIINLFTSLSLFDLVHRDEIYFSMLNKEDKSFSTPVRINDSVLSHPVKLKFFQTGTQSTTQMLERIDTYHVNLRSSVSASGKYLVAAWNDYRQEGTRPIYISYSQDGGRTWSRNQPVAFDLSDRSPAFDVFVGDSGVVHLIFHSIKDDGVYHAVAGITNN